MLANWPTLQLWHVVEAGALLKLPGSQGVHSLAAAPEYVPWEQAVQGSSPPGPK
jgi:hypothetical protein